MRSKALCAVFCLLLAISVFMPEAHARKSFGGGWGNSSSSRSSSFGSKSSFPAPRGYGNSQTNTDRSKNPFTGGYGNSGTRNPGAAATSQAGPGQSRMTPLQQQMNRSFSKQESARAYEDYKAQKSKFQMSSNPGGYKPSSRETATINSVQSRSGYSSGSDYYARRTVFYDTYRWSPPVYMYGSYSRFGIWDAMMLWFMLDHINEAQYAAMYYHHQNDPGMQQFRGEVERLSAENADLKAKVAKLDQSSRSLEQQGVKKDPAFMPQDADGIAFAADIASKEPPKSNGSQWIWLIGLAAIAVVVVRMRRRGC